MTAALARALMTLAICCLGETRRKWAIAMQAEFGAAHADGRPLAFAAGCLIAALREMPRHAEGRLGLASHALAVGVLVPVAFLQFACAIGLSVGRNGLYGVLAATGSQNPLLANAQLGAMPTLLVVWFLLGLGHLYLAWVLLERDWPRVFKTGALIASAMLTLFIFVELLLLDAGALIVQTPVLTIELIFIFAVARWHARVFSGASLGTTNWQLAP